jgi:hypothetical protein
MASMTPCATNQPQLFNYSKDPYPTGRYRPILTITENRKGVIDVDTVKGCTLGMKAYPKHGCYGECYAARNAARYGIDFSKSVSRQYAGLWHRMTLLKLMMSHSALWYRIGTAGDPSHDWTHAISICRDFRWSKKTPVIITKHWITLTDSQIEDLNWLNVVVNTSSSGMDTDDEIKYRVSQLMRLRGSGLRSVCRVVTCDYGTSEWARSCKEKQDYLLSLVPVIDNPLRVSGSNERVVNGDILTSIHCESIGGGKTVSLHSQSVYLGHCKKCPDQCGVDSSGIPVKGHEEETFQMANQQAALWTDKIEFIYVPTVIGSGYESDVARLAIEDGIAHRAARKNIQIHSAIILLINGEFSGFFTFQNNDIAKEFCLLQSVIRPDRFTKDLYKQMTLEVIARNVNNYPAIMTTNPKSTFETPALFESLGFKTYLAMSGFCYMVNGKLSDVRMKLLSHITMTNVWDSVRGEWLKLKKEWNQRIDKSGVVNSIPNPTYATREGCWQGTNGFANVVTGHSHNGNASVLDPAACEIIVRFFMPRDGRRIYNPFGGGVQFGYVAGACGYEYLASEIRGNQCDANNALCKEFDSVVWIKSDSSTYDPPGMFDLIFTCPPYYKVEKYVDYNGEPPEGEINSLDTYEKFRTALFSGYSRAINHLNDNCFFVIMTGDSRDKNGAYYCSESETELFLRDNGLSVYNKIVYLEAEFTRLAHAKKTLNYRKFPKREQKIIVGYKGKISAIKDLYNPIGRL